MPKELFEINAFESGNVYNADDRDIPDDAAVYSENIDPYSQTGSLMGIHTDTAVKSGVKTNRMAIINDDDTYRLVYIDRDDYDIKKIDDLHGTPSAATVVESGTFGTETSIPAMQTNNKEVHIGIGKDKDPKWVGIIPQGQFGDPAPSGIQSVGARLDPPNPFPLMHAVVADSANEYVYGIQDSGHYIYKFDVESGKLIRRSEYFFESTQAICAADSNNLYVADMVSSDFTILKIDMENMDVITSRVVTGTTGVTDMIVCGSELWLARGNFEGGGNFLFNVSTSNLNTDSSSTAATDRTPYAGADSPGELNVSAGDFAVPSGSAYNILQVTFGLPKLPLIKVTGDNNYVGFAAYIKPSESTSYIRCYYGPSSSNSFVGGGVTVSGYQGEIRWFGVVVRNNYTAGDKFSSLLDGRIYAFHDDFDNDYDDVYQVKQTDNSTYLNWTEEGSSSSVSTIFRQNKLAYDHTVTTLIDNTRVTVLTSMDIEDAVLSEVSGNFNVFSSGGQVRWAAGDASALEKKAEGEVELDVGGNTSVDGSINSAHNHFYASSFTYDGYQESPLSSWQLVDNGTISGTALNVAISIYTANLNPRVTHINIYRSSASSGTVEQPAGFFRLVKTVPLKSGWLETDSNTSNPDWGDFYTKTIIDDGTSYASYEARTGISEALNDSLPNYSISAKVNNFLYITGCFHPDFADSTNFLFKSRPFNFDQFNIVRDFLLLPSTAVAMESFNGRLYVFSDNELYVVNPDGMYIEDTIKGIGCRSQNAIVSSDAGMCWIDKNSIYLHDGNTINDIGARIKSAHQLDDVRNDYSALDNLCEFDSANYSGDIVVGYDGYRKSFCFFYQYNFETFESFDYSIGLTGGTTVNHGGSPPSTIKIGMSVTGTGIPAGTTVALINNPNSFNLSQAAGPPSTITATFTETINNYVPQCLVYTVPKNRWDVWNRPYEYYNILTTGAVNGKNNELIVSDTLNGAIIPFDPKSDTRTDNFVWYSKKFTMGESTADKKFYKAEILSEDSTPTITVNTTEDSSVYSALNTKTTARHAQAKLSVTGDATATIDSMRIVFRRLRRTKDMS